MSTAELGDTPRAREAERRIRARWTEEADFLRDRFLFLSAKTTRHRGYLVLEEIVTPLREGRCWRRTSDDDLLRRALRFCASASKARA